MRGGKLSNHYARYFGKLYASTPKSVFAAVALSLAYIDVEEKGFPEAVEQFLFEWRCLHENGIVPQKPPVPKAAK